MTLNKDAIEVKEGARKYYIVRCKKCQRELKIRNDYVKRHSGMCRPCLMIGKTQSIKHGDYKSRLYRIWLGLKHRRYKTYNPILCAEWNDYKKFKEWAINNGYNDELTIDRIDVNGNYEPSNCQWITLQENASKDKIIFNNEECVNLFVMRKNNGFTQIEMAELLGVSRNTVQRAERRAKEILYHG